MMRSEIRNLLGPRGELRPQQDEAQWKKLVVTHVENPCTFCAQDCLNKSMIQVVIEQVNYYGCRAPRLSSRPEKDKVYVARYSMDGNWYRCKIKSYTPQGAKVLYLDFGNTSSVALNEIAHLPQELQRVPPLCQKYRLEGVKPAMAVLGEAKHNEGKKWLMSFTRGQIVSAYAYRKPKFYAWIADCWVNEVNLSSRVLSMGFALPNSEFSGPVPFRMMQNGYGDVRPMMARKMPPPPAYPVPVPKKGIPMKKRELGKGPQSRSKSPLNQKNEKTVLQKRIRALEREVKQLQAAKCTPMMKNLVPLIGRAGKVHEQYTTGEPPVDHLMEGLALLDVKMEGTTDLEEELKKVEELEKKLKEAQNDIKQTKQKEGLEEKITTRNKVRKEFFSNVKKHLKNGAYVKERYEKLKATHDAIQKSYSYILAKGAGDAPAHDTESAVESYKKWKEEKKEALKDMHKNVTALRGQVSDKLKAVAKAILDDDCDPDNLPDVDASFIELRDTARKEAKCMLPDKDAVGGLARIVKTALQTEMDGISTLALAQIKFTTQAEDLEKWLNTSPDVEGVRDYEKELRALRSRMRRKLVDLMDEEEEKKQSQEDEGIKGIKKELGAIRVQSQDMEKKMSELKRVMNEHFPELTLLHPDLNLTEKVMWGDDCEDTQSTTKKDLDDDDQVKTQLAELREELERMTEDD